MGDDVTKCHFPKSLCDDVAENEFLHVVSMFLYISMVSPPCVTLQILVELTFT